MKGSARTALVVVVLLVALPLGGAHARSEAATPTPVVPGEWIVFEHFGQAPDGSTMELDFHRRMIWLVKADGSDLHELAPGQPPDGKSSMDISPDGTRVVFSSWTPRALLYEVGIDGGELVPLSGDCSGLPEECQEWDPAYSPDGSRIAFVHLGAEGGTAFTRIAHRDLASGETVYLDGTRVPFDEAWLNQPTWSPDGTQLAYHRASDEGDAYPSPVRIWVVGADGSGLRELATPGEAADPDWSPDGARILYSTVGFRESEGGPVGTPPDDIYTISPDGTDAQLLCRGVTDIGCWAPSWMPGGDAILYWGNRTWNLMGSDGSDKHPVDSAHLNYFGDTLGYGYSALWQPVPVKSE